MVWLITPNETCHKISKDDFAISWMAESGKVTGLISVYAGHPASYLHVLNDPNKFFVFKVYNDGRGCLVVTGFGQ